MPTYLITGANRGLGLEFARQLSTRGKDAVILATARDPDKATDLARLVHEVLPLDAADPASHTALAEKLGDRPVDVLINNAGVSSDANALAKLSMEELQRVFAVNAFAPLLITKAVLKNLKAGQRKTVFSISSQLGSITNNKGGSSYPYRASKTALNQLNASLSNEFKGDGFTCVVVHPGWVQTDMGGPNATLTPEQSISGMLKLLDGLKPEDTGGFFQYDGSKLPW